jgi:hypothetical protein
MESATSITDVHKSPTASKRSVWFEALGWCFFTILIAAFRSWIWPQTVFHAGWLRADQGWNLTQIDQLLAGAQLYSDVATPYGPFPYWWHLLLARIFGNTVQVFVWGQNIILACASAISWLALRKKLNQRDAFWSMLVGILPFNFRAVAVCIFDPWAILQLACLIWMWKPPSLAGKKRDALLLGVLIGLGQFIKFGHFAVFGASIVLIDLIAVYSGRATVGVIRFIILRWLWIGVGFVLIEAFLVCWLWATLSHNIAFDAAWPSYQMEAYKIFGPDEQLWGGVLQMPWKALVGRVLPALLLMGSSFALLWRHLQQLKPKCCADGVAASSPKLAFLLSPLAYLIGCLVLFSATDHLWNYFWILAWSVPWIWSNSDHNMRLASRILCIAIALTTPLSWLQSSTWSCTRVHMPEGSILFLPESDREQWQAIRRIDSQILPEARPALFLGWHGLAHFLNHPPTCRHSYPLIGWVRPHEASSLRLSLAECSAVVMRRHRNNDILVEAVGGSLLERLGEWSEPPSPLREAVADRAAKGAELVEKDGWLILLLSSHNGKGIE